MVDGSDDNFAVYLSALTERIAVMVCASPGGSVTAALRMLLASAQIICFHSSSPKSARDFAPWDHGFQATVVWEFFFSVRMRLIRTGSMTSTALVVLR